MALELAENRKVALGRPSLDFMIDHVFLPPRLPQKDDSSLQHSLAMIQFMCDSVTQFLSAQHASLPAVQPALETLERFVKTVPGQDLDEAPKAQILRDMIAHLKIGGTYIQTPMDPGSAFERPLT